MTTKNSKIMPFEYNDGGRAAAGFTGAAGDCVVRSIAIAAELPYQEVYDRLAEGNASQRRSKRSDARGRRSARDGILVQRKWFKDYMSSLGWQWTPTMHIGTGCVVHLVAGELPMGRLIVSVSKHYTAVIDGVIHDIGDPQRETLVMTDNGTRVCHRCVYGYWTKKQP